ncbi:MAG: hypothetical protein ACFCUV_19660 [Rivularia sp. (in: cyanobacteria)]
MSDQDINDIPLELSEEELEGIAGGVNIFFSGSMFGKSDIFSVQRQGSKRRRGSSIFKSSQTSSSAFQVIGLGLNSPDDILSFFSGLAQLFGRK